MNKIHYITKNWKLILHILIKTKHFGVNNHWWQKHPSCIGIAWYKQVINLILIYPIVQNYYAMRMRALSGWVEQDNAKKWF
jgi:hypothetical protein